MIVEYIRYSIATDQQEAFINAIEGACKLLADSPDCLAYELSQGDEEPENFIWRIEWQSVDRHMNGFRKGDLFPQFFQLVKPFYNQIQDMKHYNSLIQS